MLKNLGVVQACCHAKQFKGNLGRKLDGRPVLEWVIRRVSESLRINGVIVVTCNQEEHRFLEQLVPCSIPFCRNTQLDDLGRFARAMEKYPSEGVVRICGDNVFIDPVLIDRLITTAEAHPEYDYVSFCSRDGQPTILSPVGIYAEWFRSSALHKANRLATEPEDRECVTRFIYSNPDRFKLGLLPAPEEIDREDVRLATEREEDWDHVLAIYEVLGYERMDWRRIANLLDQQPGLRTQMAALNRETAHCAW